MTENNNNNNNNNELINILNKAFNIVDEFSKIIQAEIIEKNGLLPMTKDYESLDAALGYIGLAIEKIKPDEQDYYKLVIDNPATRKVLSDAYFACDAVSLNTIADTDIDNAVNYLKCCYYAILNKLYTTPETAQNAINNILEICDRGEEILDNFDNTDDKDFDAMYMNTSGQRLHSRLDQLRDAFKMLRPKYKPEASEKKEE